MMDTHRVVRLTDLEESQPQRYELSGHPVMVVLVDGVPHALSDVCPHVGASLSGGVVKDGCVTCPSHLWRFSLTDGARQGRSDIAVPVYPVRQTSDGWLEVEVPPAVPVRSMRETLLAHARGELID